MSRHGDTKRATARWARGHLAHPAEATDTLRQLRRQERELIDSWPHSTELFNADGECLHVNDEWERLWQMPRTIVDGYNMLSDPHIQSKHVWPHLQRAFRGEPSPTPEAFYHPAEDERPGRPRWTDGFIFPVLEEAGRVARVVLMLRDATEHHNLRDELALLRDRLQEIEAQNEAVVARLRELSPEADEITRAAAADAVTGTGATAAVAAAGAAPAAPARATAAGAAPAAAGPAASPGLIIHPAAVGADPNPQTESLLSFPAPAPSPAPRLPVDALSDREAQIAVLIATGRTPKEIAFDLGLGVKTVYTIRERIRAKLGLHTDAELIARLAGVFYR